MCKLINIFLNGICISYILIFYNWEFYERAYITGRKKYFFQHFISLKTSKKSSQKVWKFFISFYCTSSKKCWINTFFCLSRMLSRRMWLLPGKVIDSKTHANKLNGPCLTLRKSKHWWRSSSWEISTWRSNFSRLATSFSISTYISSTLSTAGWIRSCSFCLNSLSPLFSLLLRGLVRLETCVFLRSSSNYNGKQKKTIVKVYISSSCNLFREGTSICIVKITLKQQKSFQFIALSFYIYILGKHDDNNSVRMAWHN